MISQITICGFKSYLEKMEIKTTGCTVITGINSSGKSTILQALTLFRQTQNTEGLNQAGFKLNGSLVQLGNSSDVLSASLNDKTSAIGIRASLGESKVSFLYQFSKQELETDLLHFSMFRIESDASYTFELDESNSDEFSLLNEFSIYNVNKRKFKVTGIRPESQVISKTGYAVEQKLHIARELLLFSVPYIEDGLSEIQLTNAQERLIIADIRERLQFEESLAILLSSLKEIREFSERCESGDPAFHDFSKFYTDEIEGLNQILGKQTLPILFHLIGELEFEDLIVHFRGLAADKIKQSIVLDTEDDFVKTIGALTSSVANTIFYLGPLRESPKLSYSNTLPNTKFVGVSGQDFVAALHINRDKVVEVAHPDAIGEEPLRMSLKAAFSDLLRYLGVCEDVEIEDNGAYGLRPQVVFGENIKPQKSLYTNVGIGVSQIAPLLLQILLIDRDDCLLIEQPELHLHPAIQFKLGRLLFAQISLGKQIIIETHSEHIINALRISVARNDLSPDQVSLYFVTKPMESSGSIAEEIKVEENGFFSEWPSGFFDEAEKASYELLKMELDG